MGLFDNVLGGSSSGADTGAFAHVLDSDATPSFGAPATNSYGSFSNGALDLLSKFGNAAAGAFSNALSAKYADPTATAAAAQQVQQVQQQQTSSLLIFGGIAVVALVAFLALREG
jgi:hypothetical protein